MNDLFLDEIVQPDEPREAPAARSARRSERAERDRRRRKRRRRNLVALMLSLLVIGGAAWAVMQFVMPTINDLRGVSLDQGNDDYPGPGHGSVDVVIPESATGGQMGEVLLEAGVVASKDAFTQAYTANPDAGGIQPGTYRLLLQMKAADAVTALLDSENRVQTKVTLPEGLRVDQILERLSSVTTVPVAEFEAAMADTAATGLPAEAGGSYEGWLFPATYTFQPGTTPTQMLSEMIGQTVANLDARGVAAADRQRVLTIASLVEREARSPEDRAMVARAIQNRLDVGMKLDIDAAVAYGAGIPGTELRNAHKDDTSNPYNLYARTGLPPTPIAAPSLVSIDAVLNPADGPWMYWVTINLDTGETRFATTLQEHNENVLLLRQWEDENQG
ncbi:MULTISPECIES: endolytic transglycosylase MltG [unclassified Actinotalea]|uniref:endolytic transglycosylase MltG n=1 Tax=unclassified Actinotalea TaxID=2638618 RepID=UPI0015F36E21|nr:MULTISPECIES: endolytic transglycosylase MltG [unclassified Actinotalea]